MKGFDAIMINNGNVNMQTFKETKCYFIYEMAGDTWNEKREFFSKKMLNVMNKVVEMSDEQGEKWFKKLSSQWVLYRISTAFWKCDNTILRFYTHTKNKPSLNDIKISNGVEIRKNVEIKGIDFDTLIDICINIIYVFVLPISFFFIGKIFNLYYFFTAYICLLLSIVIGITIGCFAAQGDYLLKDNIIEAIHKIRHMPLILSLVMGGTFSLIKLLTVR